MKQDTNHRSDQMHVINRALPLSLLVLLLLIVSLFIVVGASAETDQYLTPTPSAPLTLDFDALPTAPLISDDLLAPGCELTNTEAGVYQIVCEEDPGTAGIPTINGEFVAQGCELETPEAGVFILDCTPDPAVPGLPGEVTIQTGSIGEDAPTDFATEPGTCDGAAESYLEPGMEVVSTLLISLDNVVYNNQDEDLALYALHAYEANNWRSIAFNKFALNGSFLNPLEPLQFSDVFTIGSNSVCLELLDNTTIRAWQTDVPGEWLIETIAFGDPIDLTTAWPDDTPDLQNPGEELAQPQFSVLVDGIVFRYLMPYIEPPLTAVPSTDQIDSGKTACEGTPPSFLSIGMEVVLDGYGYAQFPQSYDVHYQDWTFDNTRVELSEYGQSVYNDILNTTPLTNIVGNLESVALTPQELYSGMRPEAVILDGPFCVAESVDPTVTDGSITEAPDPAPERFSLWWQIDINGQVGYYPENVGQDSWWLWDQEGIFPRKLSLYYMIPNEQLTQTTCSPIGLFAGQTVQPGAGAMNLRDAPNGNIIGRVEVGQAINIFGEPTCEGGANWWQTDRGGFIAENDSESGFPLLVPYVAPVMTEESVQPNPVVTEEAPREPERPTEEPPREPERPTEEPPREPERPTEAPALELEIVPITLEPTSPPRRAN